MSVLRTLADTPELGRRRDDIATGLRGFPVEHHVVYDRMADPALKVVRILHGRMDVNAQFE